MHLNSHRKQKYLHMQACKCKSNLSKLPAWNIARPIVMKCRCFLDSMMQRKKDQGGMVLNASAVPQHALDSSVHWSSAVEQHVSHAEPILPFFPPFSSACCLCCYSDWICWRANYLIHMSCMNTNLKYEYILRNSISAILALSFHPVVLWPMMYQQQLWEWSTRVLSNKNNFLCYYTCTRKSASQLTFPPFFKFSTLRI